MPEWYTLEHSKPHYDQTNTDAIANEAFALAGIDPSDGPFDKYAIIYAGSQWSNELAPQAGSLGGCWYIVSEQYDLQFNNIGVHCHELGHLIGLFDRYQGTAKPNIGNWGLMGFGGDLGTPVRSQPSHLTVVEKIYFGWIDPIIVENFNLMDEEIQNISEHPVAYKLISSDSDFLVAYRKQVGFDSRIYNSGLLIWDSNGWELEQADDNNSIGGGDRFIGLEQINEYGFFNSFSSPSSNDPDGGATGIAINEISWMQANGTITADLITNNWVGTINQDKTWSAVIQLAGDVIVAEDARLTINPGAQVTIDPYSDALVSGANTSLTEITIDGEFICEGTAEEPIKFICPQDGSGNPSWYGITSTSSASEFHLKYSEVSNSVIGLDINGPDGETNPRPEVINNTFANIYGTGVTFGVSVNLADVINNIFFNNGTAISLTQDTYATREYNGFFANSNNGYVGTSETNIYADPLFVDAANGDYQITVNSPLKNAGSTAYGPDPDGTPVDIGAYYYVDSVPLAPDNLRVVGVFGSNPELLWDCSSEADVHQYAIYRSLSSEGPFIYSVATVTSCSWVDTDYLLDKHGDRVYYCVKSIDDIGQFSEQSDVVYALAYAYKQTADRILIPDNYLFNAAYPNPFNPSITIPYALPKTTDIKVTIHDYLGRIIWSYAESTKEAGYHSIEWRGVNNNGQQAASGVYLISISTPEFRAIQKAVLIR